MLAKSASLFDANANVDKVLLLLALIMISAAYEPLGERLKLWMRAKLIAQPRHQEQDQDVPSELLEQLK